MRGRVSKVFVPTASSGGVSSRSKATRKRKLRGLNAYSIAERENPSSTQIRQHRLGEAEGDDPRRKKRRLLGDNEDENAPHASAARRLHKTVGKGEQDELDLSGGSDSEGHEWRMGEVDKDDDSDIDSEEAFGASDEEKFDGFSFGRGGTEGGAAKSPKPLSTGRRSSSGIEFGEMVDFDDSRGGGDDLGADFVDLAAMLDEKNENSEDGGFEGQAADEQNDRYDDDEFHDFDQEEQSDAKTDEEGDDVSVEDASDGENFFFSMSDSDSEENDRDRQRKLKDLVSSLPRSTKDGNEASNYGNAVPTLATALAALKESSALDPVFDREVKNLSRNLQSSNGQKRNNLVHAPLPKRQQDRIDRKAAYDKAKETLNRWVDTVKHNRRAEHLMFPLQDPHAHEPQGLTALIPTTESKPQTDLEQTIQDILQQSGLVEKRNRDVDGQIQGWEELQTNNIPLEEVMARRAELRKARELLFREEIRAKRIKKIKSKAYRRVHRKDAQKAAQREHDLLIAAGAEPLEDEKEANDRRRAEERMGARHRESRWAKGVKHAGRAAWDENARDGVTEMARRDEKLRQKIEGRQTLPENDLDSNVSSGDEEDEVTDPQGNLQAQMERVTSSADIGAEGSKLGSLKFMQRAEASRRQRNDEEIESIRRQLAGDDSNSEHDSETHDTVGRRIFGQAVRSTEPQQSNVEQNEFEEREGSSGEDELATEEEQNPRTHTSEEPKNISTTPTAHQKPILERKSLSLGKTKTFSPQVKSTEDVNAAHSEPKKAPVTIKSQVAPSSTRGWTAVQFGTETEGEESENIDGEGLASSPSHEPLIPSNIDLVRSAFGGDDVEASFAAEKSAAESSEDEKVTDKALPGWGSWTGEGISRRERKRIQERTKGRFLSRQEGVKAEERKDRGMERVIMSEKRSKKNAKYLASTLPHPFESRQQYERAIRQPIGPEWTTKEIFQNSTKPRVLVRPGRRVEPMATPIL